LRAAAGYEPAALRRAGALAVRVRFRAHGLVHEMWLQLDAEHRLVERDVLGALPAEHGCLQSSHQRVSSRISTILFFGPGTAPLITRRFRSVSLACTVRPTCLPPRAPIRPAFLTPLPHGA